MSERYSIHLITDSTALKALLPEWQALYERCPTATPFQSPAWLSAWWQVFAPGELHAVCLRAHGRLVGFAPFYIEATERVRRVLPVGIGVSDYLDVVLDPQHAPNACILLSRHISEMTAQGADLEMCELAPQAAALSIATPSGVKEELGACSICPVITFKFDARDLKGVLPAHRIQALRTAWNRARRLGNVRIEEASGAADAHWLCQLDELHRARWQSVGEPGVTADRRVYCFLEQAIPSLLEQQQARIYRLRLNGECVAVHLLLVGRQGMFSYMTGYSPEFSEISPGAIILAHVVEQTLAQSKPEFHFLRGQEPYKSLWGALPRTNMRRIFTAL